MINLIRHEPHFPFFTPVDELEQFGLFQHGAGGIAGRRDDESFDRFAVQGAVEELTRGLEVGGGVHRDGYHLHAQGFEDVAVRRVPRRRDGDAIAVIEHGCEAEDERGG